MARPLISVITPSYNQADFIEKNIRSVKNQDEPRDSDVEHIIVDGGSDDGTLDILREYEDRYNLRWVSESDRGQSHAINKGIRMAEGEWLGWQNSDDFYLPGAFDTVRETISRVDDVDVIYGDLRIVDADGAEIDRQFMTRGSRFVQKHWSLFTSNQVTFFRRSLFDDIGYIDEEFDYLMDAELFWRILDSDCELHHVPEFLGAFRVQAEAKTFGEAADRQRAERAALYPATRWESLLPEPILELLAKGLKAGYLARDGRLEAFEYNLGKALPV